MTPERANKMPVDEFTEKEKILAAMLYIEGLHYEELFQDRAIKIGTHLSVVVHEGGVASIHFREGMDKLNELAGNQDAMSFRFIINLTKDLRQLAEMFSNPNEHPELAGINTIAGLTYLGAFWGGKHGFETKTWSDDPALIKPFVESVGVDTDKSEEQGLILTLFTHSRETFIKEFTKERRKNK